MPPTPPRRRPVVLVTPPYLYQVEGPYRRLLEEAGCEVRYPPAHESMKDSALLTARLEGVDAVLASVEPYPAHVLAASRLQIIARNGVGCDAIDLAEAARRGIVVTTTPGANREAVAEHTIAMLLAVAHGFPWRDKEARSGNWQRRSLPRAAGRTLGIVGLGAIGKEVAVRAIALGLRAIYWSRSRHEAFARQHGLRWMELDELIAQADIVSLHVPATPETRHLIDGGRLSKMKPGSILVNTSRGALVDERALVEALECGRLAGAALDVFETEPLPAEHPLARCDRVLLSPHVAGLDDESMRLMPELAARSIVDLFRRRGWLAGGPPPVAIKQPQA